jgi:dephospho-CoA kinase
MIIGITGTIGAGKGTVVDYLVEKRGFTHYPVRELIFEEVLRRGMPLDRDSLRTIGDEMRRLYGSTYWIETLYKKAVAESNNAIIESIREISGAKFLKDKGAYLIAVDADLKLRYQRITERGSSTDHINFETFVAQEKRELTSTDPNSMNVLGVMDLADFRIENNGSLDELARSIDSLSIFK